MIAGALLLSATPAGAARSPEDALRTYVQARAAQTVGEDAQAGRGYAAALALAPGDETVASSALSHAISIGDEALALTAARALEKQDKLAPDARLLLLGDAVKRKDWKAAAAEVDRIDKDEVFSFMAPTLRAWVALGSHKGDPIALLATKPEQTLAATYTAEHRPLILLATGKEKQGVAELLTPAGGDARGERLRIAAAALLARKGEREQALALLKGGGDAASAAAAAIEAGKKIPGAIDTAPAGIADFLVRIASDLSGQRVPELTLSFARLATFLNPSDGNAWLAVADLLHAEDRNEAALAALARISPADPYASGVEDRRIELFAETGKGEEALALARSTVAGPGAAALDWMRLGNVYRQLGRPDEAADAYSRAIAADPTGKTMLAPWTLRFLRGDALVKAGKWTEAKASLEEAYRLAPNEATVLNYLGYSQLERRENLDEAEKLIREASRLQPQDAAITDSLGWALFLRGKTGEAIQALERAAQGQPADPAVNEHLGDAYYSAGRRFEARYAWNAALPYADTKASTRIRAKIDAGLKPDLAAP
ncbi:MAG: tetratricopeptide repeat protein [Alphaproteobacteria bacterium]|nr:MAG: tetratricopeptide repeat protein [Alphaproteobacteria bacterium]